jgi:YVTN family beta-propeller protein
VTTKVVVGVAPDAVAVDESTHTIYVTKPVSGTVSVINGKTDIVTATVTVGGNPQGIAVDESTDTIYVTNENSGTVSVIDGAKHKVTATVSVGENPTGVAVDEITDAVYVANNESSGTVSVINAGTITASPTSGPPRTSVTVSGRGFTPLEIVKISYETGIASPKSVTICTAAVLSDTSYSCTGRIPPKAKAGAPTDHNIAAKGQTSLIKVETTFALT